MSLTLTICSRLLSAFGALGRCPGFFPSRFLRRCRSDRPRQPGLLLNLDVARLIQDVPASFTAFAPDAKIDSVWTNLHATQRQVGQPVGQGWIEVELILLR